jgi:hypothetical protein
MNKNGYKSPCNRFYIGQGDGNVYLMQFPHKVLQTCGTLDQLLKWMFEQNNKNQFNLAQGRNPLQNWSK